MKTLQAILFCALFFASLPAKAQTSGTFDDLIVTVEGDSIRGRILPRNNKSFISIQQTDLQTEQIYFLSVRTIKRGYFKVSRKEKEVIIETRKTIEIEENKTSNESFRFRIEGGYSYRLGKLEETIDGLSDFRNGYIIGIAPGVLLADGKNEIGLTIDYRNHGYNASGFLSADNRVKVNTYFIGPHWNGVYWDRNSKGYSLVGVAMGYVIYQEKYQSIAAEKNTFGIKLSLGYGIAMKNSSTKMEFRLSTFAASIKNDYYENYAGTAEYGTIGSVNLTVGLVFGK